MSAVDFHPLYKLLYISVLVPESPPRHLLINPLRSWRCETLMVPDTVRAVTLVELLSLLCNSLVRTEPPTVCLNRFLCHLGWLAGETLVPGFSPWSLRVGNCPWQSCVLCEHFVTNRAQESQPGRSRWHGHPVACLAFMPTCRPDAQRRLIPSESQRRCF